MDLNNLYPTQYTNGVGYTYNQFTNKRTDTIANAGVSDSYFLGYVDPTLLPSAIFSTKVFFEDNDTHDNGTIIIESASKNNALIGYCDSSVTEFSYYAIGFIQNDGDSTYRFNTGYYRYYNNFYPEFMSFGEKISLTFRYITYDGGDAYQSFNTIDKRIDTYADIKRFLDGYINLVLTIGGKNYNVNYNDLVAGDGTVYVESTDGTGWHARLFLVTIWIAGGSTYNGSYSTSYSATHNIKTFGTFSDGTNGYYYNFGQSFGQTSVGSRYCSFTTGRHNSGTRQVTIPSGVDRCGGVFNTVEISESELPYNVNEFIFRNGIIARCTGSDAYYDFYTYITNPASIKFLIGLCFRTNPGRVASYVEDSSYATDVTGSQFAASLKTGDINNPTFKAGLEDWQYVDLETYDPVDNPQGVAVNDFVKEDLPPYDPTPPTPGGDEGHNPDNPELSLGDTEDVPGDMIEDDEHRESPLHFPVSAFMTQYVLDVNQIYNMGLTLWSAVGDPNSNVAANFWKTYTSTGTVNIANLLDFFVSVKCFPFDMTEFNYGWLAPAMTVGTGAVPILNERVWVLGVSTCTIDCGTVSTADNAFKLGVNSNSYDFRNYVNCTISCFLPFCGTVELNPADVFPYSLSCKYFVDMLSGSCTAVIWAERPEGDVPVASKTGQIGKIVPISATNVMGVIGQAISGVSNIFQSVGEVVISAAKRRALGATQAPINEASKNKEYLQEMANYNKSQTDISNKYSDAGSGLGVITGAASGIGNLMTRNGVGIPSLGAGVGLEAMHISERPYIVIRRLNYSSPNNYAHTTGFASTDGGGENNKSTIGAYSGWTVFQNVDLSGIYGTKEELEEIKMLLETGVYL